MHRTIPLFRYMKASLLLIFLALFIIGCNTTNTADSENEQANSDCGEPSKVEVEGDLPIATIVMENCDEIILELYPDVAPNTVNNFISLANKGFYDGTIFHRVIPGFMIQGGDPDGNGTGGPGYTIKGEFTSNGFENNLSHTKGVISMARRQLPLDSAGSQFFIMVADVPGLDGDYAAFGRVIEGQEVADRIAQVPRDANDMPNTPQVMKKVRVDTRGITYPEPEIIEQ